MYPENTTLINFGQEHLFFSSCIQCRIVYDFLHSQMQRKFFNLVRGNQAECLSVCTQHLVASGK